MPTLKPGVDSDDFSDASLFSKSSSKSDLQEKEVVSLDESSLVPKERGDLTTEPKLNEHESSNVFDPELSETSTHSIGNGKAAFIDAADKKETISEVSPDRASPTSSYAELGSLDTLPLQSSEWGSIHSEEIQNNVQSLDSNFSVSRDIPFSLEQMDDTQTTQLVDSLKVHDGSTKSLTFGSSMDVTPETFSVDEDKLEESTDILADANYTEEVTELDKEFSSDDTRTSMENLEWLDILGSGDLMKKTIITGEGKETRPDRGQLVTVNVEGRLDDGRIVECCERLRFTIGDAEVVQGLDLALPLMEKGETAEILVKPRFAYDSLGKPPEIPPNTTITYNVELLDVENAPELEQLSFEERMAIGAIDFLDAENQNFNEPPEDLQELLEARMKVYNNIAAAQMKLEAHDAALKSIDTVLKVQPDNVKALFRKGKILAAQGNLNDAITCMKKALHLEPETKVIHQELTRLRKKKKTQNKLEKDMYRRMLGQKLTEERNSKTKSSLTMWGTILGGIAAVVVGIFVYRQYHGGW